MKKATLRWAESARDGLLEVVEFVAERSESQAEATARSVLNRLERIRALPLTAPPWPLARDPSFRRLVVDEVVVIYRVVDNGDAILVLSVRHGRRRPASLRDVNR